MRRKGSSYFTGPKFGLIGRSSERDKLIALLKGSPLAVEISATTVSEAAAFVGACIDSLVDHERDSLWSRAICIDSSQGLRSIVAADRPMIIIASGDIQGAATRPHHRIIVKTSRGTSGANVIELGAQPISALVEYLANRGMDRNDAYERCQEAGGYLERVRHSLFVVAPPLPNWAAPQVGMSVAVSVLIGEWDEDYETDKKIVAAIAGVGYEEFVRGLTPYQSGPLPLVSHAGTVWKVYSRPSTWKELEPLLTTRQLETFLEAARDVLLEADPRFDLAPTERWMASVHDKRREHSNHLRNGLAGGMLHAAVLGRDDSACYAGRRAQSWIDSSCRRIFEKRIEPDFWRRVRGELRELAEASPDQFLSGLEADLAEVNPQVCDLFEEEGDHGSCLHSDLLWALELLAWAPEFVGRAALALSRLAACDPGGRWSNRPHSSLTEILLPARPQCGISRTQRSDLFALLTERFPEVGWNLGKALMPTGRTMSSSTARPQLRAWAPERDRKPALVSDYWTEIQEISERLLALTANDPRRWYFLLSSLNCFLPPLKERVLRGAEEIGDQLIGDDRLTLWTQLRKLLHNHHQFSETEKVEWVYPREVLDRLEALYASLAPADLVDRVSWLFSHHVERPIDVATDWREEQERINLAQAEAADALAKLNLGEVISALPRFQNPRLLGYCLARSLGAVDMEAALLRRCAVSYAEPERDLARGFSAGRHEADPTEFLRRWGSRGSPEFISERCTATMLQGPPASPGIWDMVDAAGSDCRELFWRETHIHLFDRPREAQRAARNLLSVGRALSAIDLLAANTKVDWLKGEGDVRLFVEALEAGVGEANVDPHHGQRVGHDITRLIKMLAESNRLEVGELMHLEWIYFALLEYQAQHDLVIYQHLSSDPELLLQLISMIYLPEGESKEDRPQPSDAERAVATQAWRILNEWKPFSGVKPAEMPSSNDLAATVERIRALALERRHAAIADDYVGKALASAPDGSDGIWPHESVRGVLERYSARELADGFVVGKRNLRGTTMRSPGDGGEQERQLAADFEAGQRALAVRFPRTSALLGLLAADYRSDANREDVEVRKR